MYFGKDVKPQLVATARTQGSKAAEAGGVHVLPRRREVEGERVIPDALIVVLA